MNKPKREDYATAADFHFWMCAWQHDEIERLRQELRRPMGCTYDSEGRPLTVCHELATLRAILAAARARLVDAYGERCAEFDQDCDGCQTWGLIDRMDAALAGAADQPDAAPRVKRAYYETHEPPHCPTCECGADNSAGITE